MYKIPLLVCMYHVVLLMCTRRLAGAVFAAACVLTAAIAGYNSISQRNRHLAGGRMGLPYHSIKPSGALAAVNGSSGSSGGSPRKRLQSAASVNLGLGFKSSDAGDLAGTGWQQWGGGSSSSKGLLGQSPSAATRSDGSGGLGLSRGLGSGKANGSSSSIGMQGWGSTADGWDDGWDDLEKGVSNGGSNTISNTPQGSGTGLGFGVSETSRLGSAGSGSGGSGSLSPRRSRLAAGRNQSPERAQLGAVSTSVGSVRRAGSDWQRRRKSADSDFEEW